MFCLIFLRNRSLNLWEFENMNNKINIAPLMSIFRLFLEICSVKKKKHILVKFSKDVFQIDNSCLSSFTESNRLRFGYLNVRTLNK